MTAAELQLRMVEPGTFRCLGLTLKPLTIGHRRVMRKLECFPPRGPFDLAMCCVVCALPAKDAIPFMRKRWFALWVFFWRLFMPKVTFEAALSVFADYIQYNTELPIDVRPETEGESWASVIPFDLHLQVILQSRLGYRPEHVDEVPVLDALWLKATLDERDGKVRYLDSTESDFAEQEDSIDWDRVAESAAKANSKN